MLYGNITVMLWGNVAGESMRSRPYDLCIKLGVICGNLISMISVFALVRMLQQTKDSDHAVVIPRRYELTHFVWLFVELTPGVLGI